MTYQEFKSKYNNKYTDYDGYYGCQCWDLAQRYFTEVLGLPDSVLSGCGLVSNMLYPPKRNDLDKYFNEVPVTEMYPGDVCIWEYGHIAIFDNWDGNSCWYFSQNPNPCKVMQINRGGMHAFRLKSSKPTPAPTPAKKSNEEIAKEVLEGKWGNGEERKQRLKDAGYNYQAVQDIVNAKLEKLPKNELTVGTRVKTIKTGNGSSDGSSNRARSGMTGTIIKIINAKYPYLIADNGDPIGWYKEDALKRV